jgi:hypothetical protein
MSPRSSEQRMWLCKCPYMMQEQKFRSSNDMNYCASNKSLCYRVRIKHSSPGFYQHPIKHKRQPRSNNIFLLNSNLVTVK